MSINKSRYNDSITQRGSFAMIPNEIWESDLDHTAKVIWCYLVSRAPYWDSSRNNLSRNLNMHHDTISKYIELLKDRNMIVVTIGSRKSWSFEIIPPSDWAVQQTGSKENQSVPQTSDEPAEQTSTEPKFRPVVNHPAAHTQEDKNPIFSKKVSEDRKEILKETKNSSVPTREQWDAKEKMRNRQDKSWVIRPYPYV